MAPRSHDEKTCALHGKDPNSPSVHRIGGASVESVLDDNRLCLTFFCEEFFSGIGNFLTIFEFLYKICSILSIYFLSTSLSSLNCFVLFLRQGFILLYSKLASTLLCSQK